MQPEHIITIIVRMRNEVARVANQVAGELDKVTGNQVKQTKATRDSTKAEQQRAEALKETVDGYRKLREELKFNQKPNDDQIFALQRYREELSKLAKQQKPGSEMGNELNRLSKEAQKRLDLEKQVGANLAAERKRQADEAVAAEAAAAKELERVQKEAHDRQLAEEERHATARDRIQATRDKVRRERLQAALESETRGRAFINEAIAQGARDDAAFNKVLDSKKGTGVGNTKDENVRIANANAVLTEHLRVLDEVDRRETLSADHRISEADRVKDSSLKAYNELDDALDRLIAKRDSYLRRAEREGVSDDERIRVLRQYRSEFQRVGRATVQKDGPGSDRSLRSSAEIDRTSESIDHLNTRIRTANRDTNLLQDVFNRAFRRTPEQISEISDQFDHVSHTVNRAQFGVAKFDNILRGLIVAGAVIFLQQLVGVVVALAGALVALASAAVQAGAAVGGALVAGAAQALPALGLLAAAWGRVGAVFDALKARQKANLTATQDQTAAMDKQRAAAEQVRSAQQALADAHERVGEAQAGLTKARADARRELEELMAAERRAELQARQADLAQRDAERALRLSRSTGDVDSNESNELNLESANLSLGDARTTRKRARADAAKARTGGIEGNAGVIAAAKALRDANQAAAEAGRQLVDARRSAADTAGGLSTAAQNVANLLAQLSPAERRLYDMLARVQDRYKEVFTGEGGILESITDSFTHGGEIILDLLEDKRLVAAADNLADGLAEAMNRIFDGLSNERSREFLVFLTDEAVKNLPMFVSLLENVGSLLRTISIAGAPAFAAFLSFLNEAAGSADDATSEGGGFTKLRDFLLRGEEYAESILKLGYAIAQLFGAIIGISADDGVNAFDKMTGKVQEWTKYIHENQAEVDEFFKSAIRASGFVLTAFGKMAVVILKLFNEDHVREFSEGFSEILLPALESVFTLLGLVTHAILTLATFKIGNFPIFGAFLQFGLAVGIFVKLVSPLVRGLTLIAATLGRISGSKALLGLSQFIALAAGRGVITAFAIVASLLAIISQRSEWLAKHLGEVLLALSAIAIILVKTGGVVGAFTKFGAVMSGLGLGSLVTRLGRVGNAFSKILGPVTALIAKIPVLNKLLGVGVAGAVGAAATGGAVAGGTRIAATAAAGGGLSAYAVSKFGADAARSLGGREAAAGVSRFAGFLKTSIITSLVLAVGTGIYRGFKNKSVDDGIRDFGASLTLGLIDSVKEKSTKLQEELAKAITPKNIKTKTADQLLGSRLKNVRQLTTFGGGASVPIQTGEETNPLLKSIQERFSGDKGKKIVSDIQGMLNGLKKLNTSGVSISNKIGYDQFIKRTREFRDSAPKELRGAMNVLIQEAKDKRKELMDALNKPIKIRQQRADLVVDFGTGAQREGANAEALIGNFMKGLDKLPEWSRKAGKNSALAMVDGLESQKKITKEKAEELRDGIADRWTEIRDRSERRARQTRNRTARQIAAMVTIITSGLTDAVTSTNTFLDLIGVKKVKMPDGSTKKSFLGVPIASTPGDTSDDATQATGGWVGKQGERGKDVVRTWLGRGEAVLNWAQQRAVNSAMGGRDTLSNIFKRVKGEHAGPVNMGSGPAYARGREGDASSEGINVLGSKPGFAVLMSHFRRLFGNNLYVMSGFRSGSRVAGTGSISNHASGNAIDISNPQSAGGSPSNPPPRSNLDRLAAYISRNIPKPPRKDFLWRTTVGGNHFNHIHLGMMETVTKTLAAARRFVEGLPGATGSFKGVYSTEGGEPAAAPQVPVPKLKVPDLGSGPLASFAEALLRKATRGATRKMENASSSMTGTVNSTGGDIPNFQGPWVSVMRRIAKTRGWSFSDWRNLVNKESGGNPRATNPSSGAFGLGQFLGSTKAQYAKYGATSTDPTKQIRAMAQYIKDRYNNPSNALRQWLGRSPHWYAGGGAVEGPGTGTSDSIHAKLSKGEHVWTAAEVARAGGHQVMFAMRRMFGAGGQGREGKYAAGGKVLPNQKAFDAPDTLSFSIKGLLGESSKVSKYLSGLSSRSKNFLENYRRAFSELFAEQDGIITRFTQAMTNLASRQQLALTKATYRINKAGAVVKRLSDTSVASQTIDNLAEASDALLGEKGALNDALRTTTNRLKKIRKGGVSKSEKKTYDELKGYQKKLRDGIQAVDDEITNSLQTRFEAAESYIQTFVDKANTRAEAASASLGLGQRIQALTGGASPTRNAQATAGILGQQIQGLELARNVARGQGHSDTADTIQRQIDELRVQVTEAVAAGIQGEVDEIAKRSGRRETSLGIRERIANVLGRTGALAGIINDRIASAGDEITDLRGQLSSAQSNGFNELAGTIQDRINELETSITEMAAQRLENAINLVSETAERAQTAQALRGRFADLKEKAGNFEGAFSDRRDIINNQLGIIGNQRSSLYALLGQANADGNEGQARALTEQIAELDAQIAENTQAQHENTVGLREARISAITSRGGFLGGVYGGLGNVLTGLGALTGTTDVAGQKGLLQQAGTVLGQTGSGLRGELKDNFGLDLTGLDPAALVRTLSGIDFDTFTSGMAPDDKAQFEELVNAIIENTTSQVANTDEIKKISGSTTQSFQSSSWDWFRNAVFDGNGGLLPRYTNPSLGITNTVTGFTQSMDPSSYSGIVGGNVQNGGNTFNSTVNVTEQVENADPQVISNRIYHRWQTLPKS